MALQQALRLKENCLILDAGKYQACVDLSTLVGNNTWGSITGTLSAQTDLQNILNLKAPLNNPLFTGNVGIGTNNPLSKFHINGTGDTRIRLGNESQQWSIAVSQFGAGNFTLLQEDIAIRLFIDASNGNIGLNTVSPTEKLDVGGNIKTYNGAISAFKDGSNSILNHLYFANLGNNRAYNWQLNADGSAADFWGFAGSWNRLMSIGANGNVGIGTDTPLGKLEVSGMAGGVGLRIKRDTDNTLDFYQGAGISYLDASNTGGQLALRTQGVTQMQISASGNTLIGNTVDNGTKLQVTGGITVSDILTITGNSTTTTLGGIARDGNRLLLKQFDNTTTSGIYFTAANQTPYFYAGANGVHITNFATGLPSTINAAAQLQVDGGTTKGFLGPRMTTAEFNAIASKPAGLTAYSTNDNGMLFYDGTRTVGHRYNGTKYQMYESTGGVWTDIN